MNNNGLSKLPYISEELTGQEWEEIIAAHMEENYPMTGMAGVKMHMFFIEYEVGGDFVGIDTVIFTGETQLAAAQNFAKKLPVFWMTGHMPDAEFEISKAFPVISSEDGGDNSAIEESQIHIH